MPSYMLLVLTWVLAQTAAPALPPGVEARTLVEHRSLKCPSISQSAFCDDPTIVEPTVDPSGPLDQVVFIARKPGQTTCSCGLNQGFRTVWRIIVQPIDEAVEPIARKVVGAALARLYTASP